MKVKASTVTKSKLASELDLFSDGPNLSSSQKDDVREQVGSFITEQILLSIGDLSSPISGRPWPKLSKAYAKQKAADGYSPVADLDVSGQLLGSLDYKPTADGIEVGIYGAAAPKADGHNNFSGESKIPTRRFLPSEGENFKQTIKTEIEKIVNDVVADSLDVSRKDFAEIETQDELWSVLKGLMPDFSRAEIVDSISRNPQLAGLLDEFNLLRWLRPKSR